ncbi:MAG: SpoIIE family protein phosphatase [Phycisphaeraceae bacterium]|nr:SpoIIE family protein phosphatase [Phycisphaeraceae bacterium]
MGSTEPTNGAAGSGSGPAAEVREEAISPHTWATVRVVIERLALSNNLAEVLGLVIDAMRDCLHADRASVFQFDQQTQELFVTTAHGMSQIRFPITKGIAGEAARTGRIINVPDCYADSRFNPEIDKKTGYKTRNMLTIPLMSADSGLEGVAQVLNRDLALGGSFDAADEQVARVLASQAAVAIRRARLLEAEQRKKKIEADLAVARTIQQSTFPKVIPQFSGYEVACQTLPADETGGDTFDLIDQRTLMGPDGAPVGDGLVFVLGDATGHGIGPALSVAQCRAMVRMGVRLGASVDRIAEILNVQLCDDLPPGRFITAIVGLLDPVRHELRYSAPGQAPLLMVRADGTMEERQANSMPLGIDAEVRPDPVEPWPMAPGDVFLLLSDGYFEAMAPNDEQYGQERIVALVRENLAQPATKILSVLNESVAKFAAGRPYSDDHTAVIIRRQPG